MSYLTHTYFPMPQRSIRESRWDYSRIRIYSLAAVFCLSTWAGIIWAGVELIHTL
jgi:hypothetical protein